MKSFNETMGAIYVDHFVREGEQASLDFVLKNKVSLYVMNTLYCNFILDGIEEITNIPKDKKEKYWAIACKYFDDLTERLKAVKAVYVLELITSTYSNEQPEN